MTVFLSGPEMTLPLYIYARARKTIDPTINAVSTLLLGVMMLLCVIGALMVLAAQRRAVRPDEHIGESRMTTEAHLHIDGVSHRYGDQDALVAVNIGVAKGEFVTLVGPSGCGKTTLLRIVAGLLSPTEGRIVLNGADITSVPANRRPTNLVFQRPTLFPHLDVRGNIEFGLKLAKLAKAERATRIQEVIDLLHLGGLERRRPFELSGGQMQRVSLARALVNRPEVLLLDEPLSALDMQIRLELEVELRRVHREIGATFLYVTHDQREALALADRVVVFDNGSVAQIDRPRGCLPHASLRLRGPLRGRRQRPRGRGHQWEGSRREHRRDPRMPDRTHPPRAGTLLGPSSAPRHGPSGTTEVRTRSRGPSWTVCSVGRRSPTGFSSRPMGSSSGLKPRPATHLGLSAIEWGSRARASSW